MSSPYEKAKKALAEMGYTVGKVEYWNSFVKRRMDLFGCIDAICMRHGDPLMALQVTSITNVNARMNKSHAVALQWVSTGNRFEVWGYTPKSRKPPRVMAMQQSGEWLPIREP
jgi:hypothetical protein